MAREQITIDATIAAPVEQVWHAFTTPAAITGWNFASDDWCCPKAEADLRVGGAYKARMEARDGSFGFDFEGVYEEVEPLRAITLTLADGRKACTTFAPAGTGTKMTTVFDTEMQNAVAVQRNGWQAILDNLKGYVEARTPAGAAGG